jgi:DNA-binding GntR family transcriptional regulator
MTRTAAKIAELEIPSLPQIAYAQLRDDILAGRHEAGSPLRQEELAQKMGVSRVPLREALRRLEVEGLVVQRPRRGYVVSSLDPEDIEDIFDIRAMLEERAGYLAAKRRTVEDIAEVEALLKAMDGLAIRDAADVDLFAERNRAFHARLFLASGRPQLCRTMIVLRNSVERYIRIGALIAGNLDRVKLDHYRIVDAFRRGDADETGRLSREHCEQTCERLVARLRAERRKPA